MILEKGLIINSIDDILGQKHLFGDSSLLYNLINSRDFDSLCFYGPTGTGKTTAAKLISKQLDYTFYKIHAATTSINEIKKLMSPHLKGKLLLVIDEIHQFNKSQQGLLLDFIDNFNGKLIFTSTENPYFSLIPALRSRSFIFEFYPLKENDLIKIYEKAKLFWLNKNPNINDIIIGEKDLHNFAINSNGDVRKFLNIVEAAFLTGDLIEGKLYIRPEKISSQVYNKTFTDDEYYDLLSALIKSIRGSDPDGALLWAFKLIECGVPPEVILRRLLISASEDIGNAYPDALIIANSGYEAFEKVGMPEGAIIIAHIITFLSSCPKSNRSYLAYKEIKKYLKDNNPSPPDNIKHFSKGYKYPFDYGGFVVQNYLNSNAIFYRPSKEAFEVKFLNRLKRLWSNVKNYE